MARIGIVTGLKFEAAILKRVCRGLGAEAPIIRCAAGRADTAERAALDMLDDGVGALVSFGIAGALDPSLAAGTLLLPGQITTTDGTTRLTDHDWRGRLMSALASHAAVSTAMLVSVAEPAASAAAKRTLAEATGAGAVDMESWSVANIASSRNVPFLAVRAVADEAGQGLPRAALVAMQPDGSISIGRVLAALLRAPWQTGALVRLGQNNKRAKITLARVAQRGMPRFEFN